MMHMLLKMWQPYVAVLGFSLFWTWESISPFFQPGRRLGHAARNLTIASVNLVLLTVTFAGSTVWLAEVQASGRLGLLNVVRLPFPVHFAAAFLLLDVWTYWWHRANHRIFFLWRFHRMHHSDPQVDVSTATRFHLGEITLSSSIRLGLIPLIGVPIEALLCYDLSLLALTQFHHANLALPPRADHFLRYWIVSPNMHKVHHSRVQVETDSNYSSVLSLWDRLFGSYREKENYREIRFGLKSYDSDDRQSLEGLMLTPLLPR